MVRNATIGRWGSSVAPLCKKVHMMFGAAGLATLISACALAPEEGPVVFFGTLPCADCPGVDWRLRLFADGRGELERRYRDRDGSHHAQGRWSCGSRGESLRLTLEDGSTIHLALLDALTLRLLDSSGQPIVSSLPYELHRRTAPGPYLCEEVPVS